MWKLAWKNSLSFFGWNIRTLTVPPFLWLLGAFIYFEWQGVEAVLKEIVVAICFGLIPIGIFLIGLYFYNLIRAPVILSYERKMQPCLEVMEPKEQQEATGSVETSWVLPIRNSGIKTAEECHAKLEQISTERSTKWLDKFPTDRDLHWAGQAEGMSDFKILGQQSAKLGLIYFGGDKKGSITLALRADKDYRLNHELTMFNEPILLLLNIKSKDTSPLYVVIRIDLKTLAENLLIPPKDKPICEVKWQGNIKRDLSEYIVDTQETSS